MILDRLALLSDAQAIVADAASTNSYDLGAPGIVPYGRIQLRRREKGDQVPLLIQVVETFDALTSLNIKIQSDDDPAFGSPTDVMVVNVLLADLVKGYICPVEKLPRGVKERYIRMFYDVVGANPTVGKITAGFVAAVDGSYQGNP